MARLAFEVAAPEAGALSALVLVDPLSRTAQRLAPLLEFLRDTLGLGIKVPLKVSINHTLYCMCVYAASCGGSSPCPLCPTATSGTLETYGTAIWRVRRLLHRMAVSSCI